MSATPKILTKKSLIEEKVRNNYVYPVQVFAGSKAHNLNGTEAEILHESHIKVVSNDWEKSEGFYKIWNQFHEMRNKLNLKKSDFERMNAAQAPSAAQIAALIGQFFIDVTRRAVEAPDLTGSIAREITNLNFPRSVTLQDFLPYRGEFMGLSGDNDSVPLIEQYTGQTDTVSLGIAGLGWITTLANILWNPIHNLQKVSQCVANAYTDLRNAIVIGTIVGAIYTTAQTQAAVTATGATYDVNVYQTVKAGIKKLRALLDILTNRPISTASGIKLLCNSNDAWDLERVIYGQLVTGGANGTISAQNVQALPIDEIIVYDQGIQNGFTYMKKTLSYPGVPQGTFYLFVPYDYFTVLTKRGLTLETGPGNVLQFSQEARAWYTAGGYHNKFFLGSSHSSYSGADGYGAIVKVEMPPEEDET